MILFLREVGSLKGANNLSEERNVSQVEMRVEYTKQMCDQCDTIRQWPRSIPFTLVFYSITYLLYSLNYVSMILINTRPHITRVREN